MHRRAAEHWQASDRPERVELERRAAEIERSAAELEHEWAELADREDAAA